MEITEGDNLICPYCSKINNGSELDWIWRWITCARCGRNFMARTNETLIVQSRRGNN